MNQKSPDKESPGYELRTTNMGAPYGATTNEV
jgi:hypothetical protein